MPQVTDLGALLDLSNGVSGSSYARESRCTQSVRACCTTDRACSAEGADLVHCQTGEVHAILRHIDSL